MDEKPAVKISIFSNYTARPVKKGLAHWLKKLDRAPEIVFSEYYQFIPQLYDLESQFYRGGSFCSVIFFRYENCFASASVDELDVGQCEVFIRDFYNALVFSQKHNAHPIVVIESPLDTRLGSKEDLKQIKQLRNHFGQSIANLHNVYFEPQEKLIDLYPMSAYHEEASYVNALIPYSVDCYTALATLASRKIAALLRKPKKVVVLDCDNTLWGGVAAEGGASNVDLNEHFLWLQRFMVDLCHKGFLLCLCSKNAEQDVWDVFELNRNEMPLRKEHVIAWRINWALKSENIFALSKELNLGLDSVIFLDDNPAEIGEVETAFPSVVCLKIPDDPTEIPNFIKHQWVFDVATTSDLDKKRTEYYRQEVDRKATASEFSDYDQFLKHLKVELDIAELTEGKVDRVSQLTFRTNQFNFSGVKLTHSEVAERLKNPFLKCSVVTARDRFGDYGVVACLLYCISDNTIILENFMLSCRALGKKIEYQIWDYFVNTARSRSLIDIEIIFKKTPRNQPAVNFLTSLGLIDSSYSEEVIRLALKDDLCHQHDVANE